MSGTTVPKWLHDVFGERPRAGEVVTVLAFGVTSATCLMWAMPAAEEPPLWRWALAWLLTADIAAVLAALPSPRDVSVFEVSLFCLLEHVVFRPTVSLDAYPKLRAFAQTQAQRPSAQRTVFQFDPRGPAKKRRPPLTPPALDPATVPRRTTSGYPEEFRARVLPREKRALGDALGLTRFGVNLATLFPGKESCLRHHHAREDELVFILEGEVVLRTDEGEQVLTSGQCAGFKAGSGNAHQLINRSDRPVRYLEIGNRDPQDIVKYPEVDMTAHKGPDGAWNFTRGRS